jgi:hypothetical protein
MVMTGKGFSQFVSDFKRELSVGPKIVKTIRAYSKSTDLIFRTLKKIFIS